MLWDFKYLKFWKGKNYRDRNHIHGYGNQGRRNERKCEGPQRNFLG